MKLATQSELSRLLVPFPVLFLLLCFMGSNRFCVAFEDAAFELFVVKSKLYKLTVAYHMQYMNSILKFES